MKTFEEVGNKAGLIGMRLKMYIMYMKARWADEEEVQCQTGYAMEWAQRFRNGIEMMASDSMGKEILFRLRKELELVSQERRLE